MTKGGLGLLGLRVFERWPTKWGSGGLVATKKRPLFDRPQRVSPALFIVIDAFCTLLRSQQQLSSDSGNGSPDEVSVGCERA